MNTLYFKYAIEVERSRSITQAAENLFMAQPNLSKAIKELEDTLGYAIFERTPKGVIPTAQGTQFLQHARNIVQQLEQMESIADKGSDLTQRFSLSFPRVSYISGNYAPGFKARQGKRYTCKCHGDKFNTVRSKCRRWQVQPRNNSLSDDV